MKRRLSYRLGTGNVTKRFLILFIIFIGLTVCINEVVNFAATTIRYITTKNTIDLEAKKMQSMLDERYLFFYTYESGDDIFSKLVAARVVDVKRSYWSEGDDIFPEHWSTYVGFRFLYDGYQSGHIDIYDDVIAFYPGFNYMSEDAMLFFSVVEILIDSNDVQDVADAIDSMHAVQVDSLLWGFQMRPLEQQAEPEPEMQNT